MVHVLHCGTLKLDDVLLQFKMWSTCDESLICRFTSDAKDKPMGEKLRMPSICCEFVVIAYNYMCGSWARWLARAYMSASWITVVHFYLSKMRFVIIVQISSSISGSGGNLHVYHA